MEQRQKRDHRNKSKYKNRSDDQRIKNKQNIEKSPPPITTGEPIPSQSQFTVTEVLHISVDTSQQFAKRELANNWEKYEEKNEEIDNEQLTAADFEKLLLAPSSVGSHFFFNSEKNWESCESDSTPQYFNLNLQELSRNMESIPFYIRQDYPRGLFIDKEIEEMDRKANLQKNSLIKHVDKIEDVNLNILNLLNEKEKKSENLIYEPIVQKHEQENVLPEEYNGTGYPISFEISKDRLNSGAICPASDGNSLTIDICDKIVYTLDNIEGLSAQSIDISNTFTSNQHTKMLTDFLMPKPEGATSTQSDAPITPKPALKSSANDSDDELDILLGLYERSDVPQGSVIIKEQKESKQTVKELESVLPQTVGETKEDIQQWLDDILDK